MLHQSLERMDGDRRVSEFIEIDIDEVPAGTMVYNAARMPLGIVRDSLAMNGNRPPIPERHLDNGKPGDRYGYRRSGMYRAAKDNGPVLVRKVLACAR
jgi:hypothetical protein